jgi:hypothetical protein
VGLWEKKFQIFTGLDKKTKKFKKILPRHFRKRAPN